MRLAIAIVFVWAALGCAAHAKPTVVSLDYCSDQFVIGLADRAQILGLSPEADNDYSHLREKAEGLPQVRPNAEDILWLKPDLILRQWGGGANVMAYFKRFGIPVVSIDYTANLDDIRRNVAEIAKVLDQEKKGQAIIADFDARLARLQVTGPRKSVLYLTSSGFTSGQGTLVHEMIEGAGLINAGAGRRGWYEVPLEELVRTPPNFVAAGFFGTLAVKTDRWSQSRHPVMRRILKNAKTVYLPDTVLSCPGWFVMEAMEAMHEAGYGE